MARLTNKEDGEGCLVRAKSLADREPGNINWGKDIGYL